MSATPLREEETDPACVRRFLYIYGDPEKRAPSSPCFSSSSSSSSSFSPVYRTLREDPLSRIVAGIPGAVARYAQLNFRRKGDRGLLTRRRQLVEEAAAAATTAFTSPTPINPPTFLPFLALSLLTLATRRDDGETFFALSSLLSLLGSSSSRPLLPSTLDPPALLASLRGQARSNPDVTAPLSVSLGRPHGQCSLFLYIHAFHRVGLAPHTFPLVARRGYPGERLPVGTTVR